MAVRLISRTLSCAEQFRAMAFAQLTWSESLRDIETSLSANARKLYVMGSRSMVRRSTLVGANESRDWHIWADRAALLIRRARKMYASDALGFDLDNTVYALDSSTIDLCLSLFAWAPFRSTSAAIKQHTLQDLRGSIPAFIHISDGNLHDVNVPDRPPDERSTGVLCDQRVMLGGHYPARKYPEHLRRVRLKVPESGKTLVFLTNNTALPSLTIAALYKSGWQVALFFEWIKQHLRIKKLLGNSENAVKTQVSCSVATYVLMAIVKKELQVGVGLQEN